MNTPAKMETPPAPATLNDVLIRGDLSKLTEAQRTEYYLNVCRSLGLNPLTKPFDYLTLSGKLVLYAKRDAADQLRKLNGISIEIVSRERAEDLLTVHVRAKDKTGRSDEDFGVVPFKSGAGEIAANAWMKAVTKAKRRVTLSISGLGFLDETEVDSIAHDDDLIAEHDPPVEPRPYKITAQSWRMFGELLSKELRDAETKSDVFEWLKANEEPLAKMKKEMPKMYDTLSEAIEAIKAEPT